jgi:metal-responsive CopG/Arc/MetJ family transcriptional regulator
MIDQRALAHPGRTRRLTLSFDHFTRSALDALALKMQTSVSEVIREAIENFLSDAKNSHDLDRCARELATSRYGEVKAVWAGNTFQPTSKPGPTARFKERLSVTFPEIVYVELEDKCRTQRKGITQVIRLAVDTHLARDVFESLLSDLLNNPSP